MKKDSSNVDQIAAYYFARLLDIELQKLFNEPDAVISEETIANCLRISELNYSKVNIQEFVQELQEKDWELDYIYLDRKKNLYEYKLEYVQPVEDNDL